MDWFSVEKDQTRSLTDDIDGLESNRLLNTSIDDLCVYFEAKYRIDVPVLDEDGIIVDPHETQIDVSQDWNRAIRDRSRPFHVAGTAIEITVPFTGEAKVFNIQPTTFTSAPPAGEVRNGALCLTFTGTNLDPARVRSGIDSRLGEIRKYLGWLRKNADGFNKRIRQFAHDRIERRRQKLLADQHLVVALGFPLKERTDAPRTFTAPEVRRRITPAMPRAGAAPYQPEPVLGMADYEHILSVMTNMALVMELSPSAFGAMDEEALRSHFLVQLNGHYEGQATGETFNYEGKTDILIRVNGKNIFIAECKYWGGPKKLGEILEAIPAVMREDPNFKRDLARPSETNFRYAFAHRDDPNREMTLTVLAFDVPQLATD